MSAIDREKMIDLELKIAMLVVDYHRIKIHLIENPYGEHIPLNKEEIYKLYMNDNWLHNTVKYICGFCKKEIEK